MNGFVQDIRYALRQMRKNPGFTAVAVLTLALGVAVNATIFSLVSGFLLQRPPGQDPEHVVVISSISPEDVFHRDAFRVSAPNYLAWRDANHVFGEMSAADQDRSVSLAGNPQPEVLHAAAVSPNYFDLLKVSPGLGRTFASGEDQAGHDHVVILSHELWEHRFGSDRSIVGHTVRLNRENYDVIGVMPASFRMMGFTPQLWVPLVLSPSDQSAVARRDRSLLLFSRLQPGKTLDQAQAEIATLARRTESDFPETEKGWGATVRTLPDFLIYDFGLRTALAVMMTAVGFVLLIACANVAGMLLARAVARKKEVSVRISLGATSMRIVRQALVEGLLFALLGGGGGLLFAVWGVRFARAQLSLNEALSAVPIRLDWNVVLFVMAISLASAVMCSLVPALRASAIDVNTTLKDEGRGASAGRSQSRLRAVLVTGEISLALFLLVGSGMLVLAVFLLEHQNLGFQPENILTAGIRLDGARYTQADQRVSFVQDVLTRVQHLPGVNAVAAASDLPSTGPDSVTLRIQGQTELTLNRKPSALDFVVTADYFRTAGIPLLRGRTFIATDKAGAPHVVLVNQEFAHRYLANQDPLGKQIRLDVGAGTTTEWNQIVGVVGNVKSYSEETRDDPEVYEAFLQRPVSSFSIMIRASSDPNGLASPLRNIVSQRDAELPLARVMSMPAVIDHQRGGDAFFARVLSAFSVLALLLSAVGTYGLIAYSVNRRLHEIGIRMALGAESSDIRRLILWEGTRMAAIGIVIGFILALPLPRIFDAMFYGLQFREPRLYLFVPLLIFGVAALATYIPARRASRVDLMVALRYE
ncbi:MAG TPA: ABC transporter permease [Terriglobales bacterium]|nr:ABC transporter permease [Terriglobales bacterium]